MAPLRCLPRAARVVTFADVATFSPTPSASRRAPSVSRPPCSGHRHGVYAVVAAVEPLALSADPLPVAALLPEPLVVHLGGVLPRVPLRRPARQPAPDRRRARDP